MSFAITYHSTATAIHRHLAVANQRASVSMERLSSGQRINRAADDPAGLGAVQRLRGQIRGLEMAGQTIHQGLAMLQAAEGALNEVHSILLRARELAVSWNGGLLSFTDKEAILAEWGQLRDEVERIEQATTWAGQAILDGASITLQVGANDETVSFAFDDLFGPAPANLVRANTFFALPWLDADLDGFDQHITDVSTFRARLGAWGQRLEHAQRANDAQQVALLASEASIRDVDLAAESVELARYQVQQSVATAMLAQANQGHERVLMLLR